MSTYGAPGSADSDAPHVVIDAWNALIADQVNLRPPSPILVADPGNIANGQVSSAVSWPGHPLEPLNCQDEEIAAELCDWGWAGRAELHNEYLEYGLLMRSDAAGKLRPKRFVATTELMEWWQVMAVHAPDYFVSRINGITGLSVSFESIFGRTVAQWEQLAATQKASEFMRVMVGNGRSTPPSSALNQEHVLFMSHPINGLDDLIYVVHFGSFPYAVQEGGIQRRARIEEIFADENVPYLFCRNADPAAAEGAYNQAFLSGTEAAPQCRKLAFADPLGMYMRTFSTDDMFFRGSLVPTSWTRWSRGGEDTPQRLEFGPADSEEGFLDEVKLGQDVDSPTLSGYQIAKRIEVGPLVVVGDAEPIPQQNFKVISATPAGSIACGTAQDSRCPVIEIFKQEYDRRSMSFRTGTRGGPVG
ncbi:hypothetical protein CHY08_27175 (plasmid) [Rhizobium leguminosarum bv. viciae]|uniref:hypothetical protein n=1 Tax=Rhizobium leguminosarum TaxID=384 RepID=UPI000B8CDCC5|nr:hypothetical protein [Rhizobium leguminosarum]ASR10764.1 hypothetical protein CHY08_27175 [Rhizobium leguminosarum bv. viciae]